MILKNREKNKGFTLVELLIVISIIALLSAIVLTNLEDARGRARDTARIQQLTSIKTAMEQYRINDGSGKLSGNGQYPYETYDALGNSQARAWRDCTGENFSSGPSALNIIDELVATGNLPAAPVDPSVGSNRSCMYLFAGGDINCGIDESPNSTAYPVIAVLRSETKQDLPHFYRNGTYYDDDAHLTLYCILSTE